MKNRLKNLKLVTKTTIMLAGVLCMILISINIFSATYTKNIVSNKVHNQLVQRVNQIGVTLKTYDDLLKTTANSLYEAFSIQFDRIELDENQFVQVNGVKTPLITDNGMALNNNFDYVDDYTRIKGSTATIFARMGEDFVRVSTSLKRPDGSRTLGTFLGKSSPAYEAIMQGKRYFGVAHLFGNDYMAVYNPIMKAGKVIGILYVGYNYTQSFERLKKQLKSITLGQTGYLYVLSTRTKDAGKLLLHPTQEGENIFTLVPELGQMKEKSKGVVKYLWKDSKTNKVLHKTAIFENYDSRNWKLVLGITEEEFLQESTKFTYILAAISLGSIVLIGFMILFIIQKLVIKPVYTLQEGLKQFFLFLNKQSDKTHLIPLSSRDEIGLMGELINTNIKEIENNLIVDQKLIENTVEVANQVKIGHLKERITASSNNTQLNELKEVVNDMLANMQTNINNVKKVLSDFTHFNYTSRVNENNIQAEMKQLYSDINSMADATTKMLQESLHTGHSLNSNAQELTLITTQLSNSSNEQAASLEETAASLEELTSTMNNNEQSMNKMSNDANELINAITNGQKLATKTATSMDLINDQTNAIADAISVIDQIAFQTNILSLNAAVEAATAGEAGKGFAVVAGEVRNLASRSAQAANEIKQLVENATTKANEGKEIANEMITGYEHLNSNVHTTANMIEDVISNFKEQVRGIEQINDAVSSLDKLTQENATIASNASHIATTTNDISTLIVNEANKKEFEGKEIT